MHGTEPHLRSDNTTIVKSPIQTADVQFGLSGNTTIAISSCNPADIIMPRLIKAYKKRTKYAILLLLLVTIGLLIGSTLFCCVKTGGKQRSK